MANTMSSFYVLVALFALISVMQRVSAAEFRVGGAKGWSAPTDSNALTYNQWAEKHRFQVGDSLLFVYPPERDSVLLVNKDDYTSCNTGSPIKSFTDGNTLFKFDHNGAYHFISGIVDSCQKNEKMVVVVMADRSNKNPNSTKPLESPPPSSSTGTVPAPAPVGESSPSPPSPSQSPAPSSPYSPSSAKSLIFSFFGVLGTFFGSSILLLF
ncbi:hypothetical protein Syun_010181 [Stephania yunnanensis]|uniref:Phytocyanin domain-containing protein n=1 Tax=Stephania yunnanensis TaxID=152371 RepID=A0AAP0KG22_9MAGN